MEYKIYSNFQRNGENRPRKIAETDDLVVAAAIIGSVGSNGWTIRISNRWRRIDPWNRRHVVLYTEGDVEGLCAADSYDGVAHWVNKNIGTTIFNISEE